MAIRSIVPRSLPGRILTGVLVATLAYVLWHWSLAAGRPAGERQVDTMCVASRFGLPCNPD